MEPEPDSQRPDSRQSDEWGPTPSFHANDSSDEKSIIYLTDHFGIRYVLPFQQFRSKEARLPCYLFIFSLCTHTYTLQSRTPALV